MAEERIEIKYNKEDCPCIKCESVMSCEERNCEKLTEWECKEKDIVYNRQEAIERMAKALIRADYPSELKSVWQRRWENPDIHLYYLTIAEAALNALLDTPTLEERVEEICKNNAGIADYDAFYKALREGK